VFLSLIKKTNRRGPWRYATCNRCGAQRLLGRSMPPSVALRTPRRHPNRRGPQRMDAKSVKFPNRSIFLKNDFLKIYKKIRVDVYLSRCKKNLTPAGHFMLGSVKSRPGFADASSFFEHSRVTTHTTTSKTMQIT
jgi:hypothetical protein